MALVIVIGSHVAGSRVGGTVVCLALAQSPWAIDPVHVPTVLLGRHPGWGDPGGGKVAAATMAGMLNAIEANGLFALADAVITDYFADREQIEAAAAAIDRISVLNPAAHILVDPVMGDHDAGGAYVSEAVQAGIEELLVPRATMLTPNVWELSRLTGVEITGRIAAFEQARALAARMRRGQGEVLVTSLPAVPGLTGMGLVVGDTNASVRHAAFDDVPRGTGDVTAAAYLAARIGGRAPAEAMNTAARVIHKILANAKAWGAQELPIVASKDCWQDPAHD
ncbi:MAG: bifunctional hydroxymethylpyrimidine kinase/phosphomethylpyrimidine kinase [Hyphomonadaceae bacterium]|jgi:pyridoxine kinase|nr:bifunctional hydroxymethylpyrimidine kinase/phosphomethylpyrimidine kinase [Hyphomonadaceae bacterium]